MPDVFISYTRADRGRVKLVAQALEAEGFDVWWDSAIKPGRGWHETIRKEINDCHAVIVCWTKQSVKSDWVLAEATQAYNKHRLVPILLQRADPPIPYNMVQSADLSKWRGKGDDPEWTAALTEIRRLVEKGKGKIYAAVPPPGEAHAADMMGRAHAPEPAPQPQPPPQPAPQPAPQPPPQAGAPLRPATPEPPPFVIEPEPAFEEGLEYEPATTRGRMGPRLSRLAFGAAAVTAVLTAGLWAGPQVIDRVQGLLDRQPAAAPDYTPSAPFLAEPIQLEEIKFAFAEPAPMVKFSRFPELPADPEPPPPPKKPDPKPTEPAPPTFTPTTTRTPEPSPAPETPPSPNRTADPTTAALDRCLSQFLKVCKSVDRTLASEFHPDGVLSKGELTLLSTPVFPDSGVVSAQNLGVCRAVVATGPKSPAAERACATLAPKPAPPKLTATPSVTLTSPNLTRPAVTLDRPITTAPDPKEPR